MKPKSGNRFRVCGTPSKTGCITCKIRRVKCGEEKPFCKRCTSTGRKCDGYAPPRVPDPSIRKSVPRGVPRSLSSNPEVDPMENQLLYFFRTFTAPKLSGNFSSDFWERRVYQASSSEPAIRHAVIAIGAIHQDYVTWHQSKILDPSIQAFAFRQYTRAISYLHQLMSTQSQQLDMTLISCICFITFDCLMGNHESAIIHLKAGLKILEDIKSRRSPGSSQAHEWETEFAPILLSLGTQAASFVNPKQQVDRSALWVALRSAANANYSNNFQSLDQARHALDSLAADITVDRNASSRRGFSASPSSPSSPYSLIDCDTERHMASIRSWSEGLDKFLIEMVSADALTMNKTNLGASLLKLHSLIYSIVIEQPIGTDDKFLEVLAHAKYLVDSRMMSPYGHEELNFTPDMGLIAPLFFTVLRAPTVSIQQQAIDLLSRAQGREGMWDAQDALRIAGEVLDAPYLATTSPHPESRSRNSVTDRMIWPFGERCDFPSPQTTPNLEYSATFSSANTTPHLKYEQTFSPTQPIPDFKVEHDFSSLHSTPVFDNDTAFPCSIPSNYDWQYYPV